MTDKNNIVNLKYYANFTQEYNWIGLAIIPSLNMILSTFNFSLI